MSCNFHIILQRNHHLDVANLQCVCEKVVILILNYGNKKISKY